MIFKGLAFAFGALFAAGTILAAILGLRVHFYTKPRRRHDRRQGTENPELLAALRKERELKAFENCDRQGFLK